MPITLTIMPAGTSGDAGRDRDLVAEVREKTGCDSWAVQAVMPAARLRPEDWVGRVAAPMHGRVIDDTLGDAQRYGVPSDRVVIDFEALRDDDGGLIPGLEYVAAVARQALAWQARGLYAEGLYGLGLGRFGHNPAAIEALARACGFTRLHGTYYQRTPGEIRDPTRDIELAALLGLQFCPYLQGLLAPKNGNFSDRGLTPKLLLWHQARTMARAGTTEAIAWWDLRDVNCVTSVLNLWEACR